MARRVYPPTLAVPFMTHAFKHSFSQFDLRLVGGPPLWGQVFTLYICLLFAPFILPPRLLYPVFCFVLSVSYMYIFRSCLNRTACLLPPTQTDESVGIDKPWGDS